MSSRSPRARRYRSSRSWTAIPIRTSSRSTAGSHRSRASHPAAPRRVPPGTGRCGASCCSHRARRTRPRLTGCSRGAAPARDRALMTATRGPGACGDDRGGISWPRRDPNGGGGMTRTAFRSIAVGTGVVLGALALLAGTASSSSRAATPGVVKTSTTIRTLAGSRPLHMITITPGMGAHLEAIWLGGGPGRTGTVGRLHHPQRRSRGAVAGLNGDFFLLARKVPSGNLFIHRGRSFLGNSERGAAVFARRRQRRHHPRQRPGLPPDHPGREGGDLRQAGLRRQRSRRRASPTLDPYQRTPPTTARRSAG